MDPPFQNLRPLITAAWESKRFRPGPPGAPSVAAKALYSIAIPPFTCSTAPVT
jgi:hypothetical protein